MIANWALKHDKLLTVLGAIVIFFTFMAKEVYGDRAREIKTEVRAAELEFEMNYQLAGIAESLERARFDMYAIRQHIDTQKPLDTSHDEFRDNYVTANSYEEYIGSLGLFRHKLPDELADVCNAEEIKDLGERAKSIGVINVTDSPRASVLLAKLKTDVHDCRTKMLGATITADVNAKLESDFQTVVGYFLFGIGWLLTFLGKLSGQDAAEGSLGGEC